MAKIGNDRMIVRGERRADGSWLFTICYTAHFAEDDLGRRFDDSVQIAGIRRTGQLPPVCGSPVSFRATASQVFRKKRIVVRPDAYDPNTGPPAVRALIRLHRDGDAHAVEDEQHTPAVPSAR
ncbi:hypothetical protein [[Mycobacterium] burgundiense]|uniref:Uncharacterized protein n=1 Tax=[Mycobacterium] burgundiense TaxID=3064286 RepID=A0ABM9LC81_9MYCO|nr:hypothetical protein [Mycolicibacterium sp. MU0053]CAJ1496505.1 hypothetical protein MU0053_000670 [Mycolicibacterium sp. MU0053]